MKFDDALQWCIDNKASYTFSYDLDMDGSKLWTVKVSRGIISSQYQFKTPDEMYEALRMACFAVNVGSNDISKSNLMTMLDRFRPKPILNILQPKLAPGETLCDHCDAKCCKYIITHLDTPDCEHDYEWLKFYLLHPGVSVQYDIADGSWSLLYDTTCRFLVDNKCSIHDDVRPAICKEFNPPECDYNVSDERLVKFHTPEQIDAYRKIGDPTGGLIRILDEENNQPTGETNGNP